MDLYNRYLMRVFGEREHQPRTVVESITFGVVDILKKQNSLPDYWGKDLGSEDLRNAFMIELHDQIQRSMENFNR